MTLRRTVIGAALVGAALASLLSGCSPIVALDPAPHANDPACADVIVRLPSTLENLPRRETDAQATGAWGEPAVVLLRCGVTVPTASDLPCVQTDDGYQWLRDDSKAPSYVFTSYGRTPAIAVVIDQTKLSPGLALRDLESVVAYTTRNGHKCLSVEDSLGGTASGSPTPTPTPTPAPSP
ncbi:MAG: DUF3515 family protein [Pseudolysinimonas sp.]